jgi:hypothetical protein
VSIRSSLFVGFTGVALAATMAPVQAQTCQFLAPVGGNGTTNVITKTIGPGNPFGRPNWNTDFFVTQPYGSYKFFFTADSSVSATYPIQGYLKFTDGSSLQVINESFAPQMGTGRMWGPFPVPVPIRPPRASPTGSRRWVATELEQLSPERLW